MGVSEDVNGTVYCEHMIQSPNTVTVCSVWCRHFPGAPRGGVVCPFAEGQCVADHGPAPFLPTDVHRDDDRVSTIAAEVADERRSVLDRLGHFEGAPSPRPLLPAEVAGSLGEFGTAADHGFSNIVRPTYTQRGAEYGDTWAVDGLYDEVDRLADALALVRVKCRRVIGTRGNHRDSVLDLVAYASAYLAWGDAYEGWWG